MKNYNITTDDASIEVSAVTLQRTVGEEVIDRPSIAITINDHFHEIGVCLTKDQAIGLMESIQRKISEL